MNWFGRFLNKVTGWERPTSSRVIYSGRTPAGVYVDADTALKNATVWACVQYLQRAVGQLPWHVMLKDVKGNATIASGHGVDYLLNERPNPEQGSFSWRQTMLAHALLRGNAYAEIVRDNRGVPVQLWPIHPDRVRVVRGDDGTLEYEVWNSGGGVVLKAVDVFHLRGYGEGAVGYSVIEYAAQSIGWAQATEIFGSTFFGDGMNPSGVITSSAGLTPAALNELRKDIKQLYSGPRGERTAVLDAGMKFEAITTTPENGQFIETRQHQVEEICRWFGVPPHKVMHLLRATFSNIEHQSIEVVVDSVTPWVKLFEQEANYKLFGTTNRQNYYTKMSVQALMRGDNASRIQFYKGMFELGMTINQILALEDMNGIGADGDVSFVSNNVQTLERAIAGPPTPAEKRLSDAAAGDQSEVPPLKPNGSSNAHPRQH